MKTAMQNAIEYLRKYNLLSAAAILEDKFIDSERQMIIDTYTTGKQHEACGTTEEINKTGEQYYNETYKQ